MGVDVADTSPLGTHLDASLVPARHSTPVEVAGVTIDSLMELHGDTCVSLIKLDIEGYEGTALKGVETSLRKITPPWCSSTTAPVGQKPVRVWKL